MQNGELTANFAEESKSLGRLSRCFFGKIATILWAAMVASCEELFSLVLHRITQTLNLEELKYYCVHTIKSYISYEKGFPNTRYRAGSHAHGWLH